VDIREFGEWLEDDFSSELKTSHKSENPNSKETELLKVIEELKGELEQKDLIIAERDKKIISLTNENQKLKAIN
jgi:hypothetical protein